MSRYTRRKYRKYYSQKESLEQGWWLIKDDKSLLAPVFVLILLFEGAQMVSRVLVASLFDYIGVHNNVALAGLIVAILVQDMIVLVIDATVVRTVIHNIGFKLWHRMSMRAVRHVSELGADFYSSIPESKINDRIAKVDKVVDLVELACWSVFGNMFQAIISMIVLMKYLPAAVPITLLSFYIFFLFNNAANKKASPVRLRRKDWQENSVSEGITRVTRANQTLVNNTAMDLTVDELDSGFRRVQRVGKMELGYYLTGRGIMRDVVMFLGRRSILAIAVLFAYNGWITNANLVLIFTLIETMFIGCWSIVRFLHTFNYESASILKLVELMRLKPSIVEPTTSLEIPTGPLGFSFIEVEFRYVAYLLKVDDEEDPPVPQAVSLRSRLGLPSIVGTKPSLTNGKNHLHHITLDICPGEKVALVGASGSGKTTLAGLLTKSRLPHSGQILVNGVDIKEVHGKKLRSRIAVVPQGTSIDVFSDTFFYNLTLGHKYTEDQVIAAVKACGLWNDVLEWPQLIYELVGDRGRTLSGGQQQRLAIGRAVLRDPDLLILDEATSALDSETEQQVQEALEHLLQGRTALIIAHRLSTIRNADKIVVMQEGQIVETGTWHELTSTDTTFRRLVRAQKLD